MIKSGKHTRLARRDARGRELSHIDLHAAEANAQPQARMVDVSKKPVRARSAEAHARVIFPRGLLAIVMRAGGPKGPVEDVARAAGLLAAKRTSELIPMCHSLGLDQLEIGFESAPADVLLVTCRAACRGRTGVEMEAMVGAAVAALTVYDMTKGLDHGIRIGAVELIEKRGGRSGVWTRDAHAPLRAAHTSARAPRVRARRAHRA